MHRFASFADKLFLPYALSLPENFILKVLYIHFILHFLIQAFLYHLSRKMQLSRCQKSSKTWISVQSLFSLTPLQFLRRDTLTLMLHGLLQKALAFFIHFNVLSEFVHNPQRYYSEVKQVILRYYAVFRYYAVLLR